MNRKVARDSKGQIMWIQGRTDVSPLSYREWKEAEGMESGVVRMLDICPQRSFYPPFTLSEEDVPTKREALLNIRAKLKTIQQYLEAIQNSPDDKLLTERVGDWYIFMWERSERLLEIYRDYNLLYRQMEG